MKRPLNLQNSVGFHAIPAQNNLWFFDDIWLSRAWDCLHSYMTPASQPAD